MKQKAVYLISYTAAQLYANNETEEINSGTIF